MGIEIIGENIARLRREKGSTQEEVARSVGVSAQAVSKWENGGVPDTELLPGIADYFGVSVDTLFGRSLTDYGDVEAALVKKLCETPRAERFEAFFELCWLLERALFGVTPEDGSVSDYRAKLSPDAEQYSSVQADEGFTLMGIGNRISYFLLVPEVADKEKALFNGIDYPALFRDLAEKDVFDALVLLNRREPGKAFTPNLLIKRLGVEFDRAMEIVSVLHKYRLIRTTEIEMDDVTQEVYSLNPTPAFSALLIFARELIDKPNSFSYFSGGRNKPYLA